MMNNTTQRSKKMRIAREIEVFGITEFERVNHHVPSRPTETFHCITMADENANIIVTYTASYTKFAQSVKIGDRFVLGAEVTEERNDQFGLHYKAIRCQVGGYAIDKAVEKREAKKLSRMRKLGLTQLDN